MRVIRPLFRLSVVFALVVSSAAAYATTSTMWQNSSRAPQMTGKPGDPLEFSESLRQDVARHPNDFVTFTTHIAALRFIEEHGVEAYRESDRRMVDRGVMGYWRNKTVVVIPLVAAVGNGQSIAGE